MPVYVPLQMRYGSDQCLCMCLCRCGMALINACVFLSLRISVLIEQKTQQINDLLNLEEESRAIEEKSVELEDKLCVVTDQCSGLVER